VADPKSPQRQFVLDAHERASSRHGTVHAVAFAPDARTLVSGGDDGVVRFWDLRADKPTERSTLRLNKGVGSINYSPDGSKLVVVCDNGYLFLGDSSGKKLRAWQLEGSIAAEQGLGGARFAPDGRHLLIENSNATAYIVRLPR